MAVAGIQCPSCRQEVLAGQPTCTTCSKPFNNILIKDEKDFENAIANARNASRTGHSHSILQIDLPSSSTTLLYTEDEGREVFVFEGKRIRIDGDHQILRRFLASILNTRSPESPTRTFVGLHLWDERFFQEDLPRMQKLSVGTWIVVKFCYAGPAGGVPARLILAFAPLRSSLTHLDLANIVKTKGSIDDRDESKFMLGTIQWNRGDEFSIQQTNRSTLQRLAKCSQGAYDYLLEIIIAGMNNA